MPRERASDVPKMAVKLQKLLRSPTMTKVSGM